MPLKFNLFLLYFIFFQLRCATYTDVTASIRQDFRSGRYERSLENLEKSPLKTEEKNRLLFHLEKAMILDRLGEKKKSRSELLDSDRIADELYTVSISKSVATFLVNDMSQEYGGEDYEKVLIHTIMALSFLEEGDYKSARIAAAKINNKLHAINSAHDDQKSAFKDDAFALEMAGMIFESLGEIDNAIVEYRKALEIYQTSYKNFYSGETPSHVIKALYRLSKKRNRQEIIGQLKKNYDGILKEAEKDLGNNLGDLIVIHEVGNISPKVAKDFALPINRQIIRFSFPIIKQNYFRSFGATGIILKEKDGQDQFFNGTLTQDLNAIAYQCLEDKRLRMILKQGARLLIKGQITDQAYQNFGPLGGIAANIYSVVSETADTRAWSLLPGAFYVTRARIKAGNYNIVIRNDGSTSDILPVEVKANGLKILRSSI